MEITHFHWANFMCREMVGTDNKLLDELRHIQVWIVLTGYQEAVSSLDLVSYHHLLSSRIIVLSSLCKLHELPKKAG